MNENNIEDRPQSEYDKENSVEQQAEDVKEKEENQEWSLKDGIKEEGREKSHRNKEVAKLEKALAAAIEERDSFKDSYQRTYSDYNNYKKRNQALTSQAMKAGASEVIEKILPVLDNLERALAHTDEERDDSLAKGVSMVYKQLSDIIAAMGVKEIPALGCEFDPNLHQAIQQVETPEGATPGTIAEVALKGYMLDDRIIRHSMVIVNK